MPAGRIDCCCLIFTYGGDPSTKHPLGCAESSPEQTGCNFVSDCEGYCPVVDEDFPEDNIGEEVEASAW
jgi:hypothetical protein